MRTARAAAVVFAILLTTLSALSASSGATVRRTDYRLLLKSGEFVPDAGVDARLAADGESAGGHVIVQFHSIPGAAEVEDLEAQGIRLLDYLPNLSYYASVPPGRLPLLGARPAVRAVLPILPRDKLAPAMAAAGVRPHASGEDGSVSLVVVFHRDISIEKMLDIARSYGRVADVVDDDRTLALTMIEGGIGVLAAEDAVQYIDEGPPPRRDLLDRVRPSVGADIVQAPPYNLDGSGAVLGMWESSAPAETHVDFTGRLTLADGAATGTHATAVGGIMMGDGTGSEGWGGTPYQWRGIATEAELVSYSWASSLAGLRVETAEAISTYGIILANNSWGWFLCGGICSQYGSYDPWSKQYDKIVRGIQGAPISVVFGAGNEQNCVECEDSLAHFPYGTISPPGATAKNTIAVGAVHSVTRDMTDFSGWGPTLDGRVKPDIVAPGCNDTTGVMAPYPPNDYDGSLCGTSWSTPVVSGSIAILAQQFSLLGHGYVMPHTYKAIFIQTAEDLGNPGPDYVYGHGHLDLKAAVDLVIADWPAGDLIRPDSIADSTVNVYYMDVPADAEGFRVTLVWDDFQAAAAAAKTLVNDLDLVVKSPAGTPHHAYVLDPENPSAPATLGYNDIDNVEVVEVTGPAEGRWTVEVRGTLVPEAPAQYTVVMPYEYLTGGIDGPAGEDRPLGLLPASPNPFEAATLIRFDMAEPAPVGLVIYDARGRVVRTLIDGAVRSAGRHMVRWDGSDDGGARVAPGVFFLRMETQGYSGTEPIVLVR